MVKHIACKVILATLVISMAGNAFAQVMNNSDIYRARTQAYRDNTALGHKIGSFVFTPALTLQQSYDDNIRRSATNEKKDFITAFKPALGVQSDWSRHSLTLGAEGDISKFHRYTSENYNDYTMFALGQVDLSYETYFTIGVNSARLHQGRNELIDTGESNIAALTVKSTFVGFTRALTRIKFRIFAKNEEKELEAVSSAVPSVFLSATQRTTQSLNTMLAYEFMPGNSFFISNLWEHTDYNIPGSAIHNSDGQNWRLGYNFDFARGLGGSFYGGYLYRSYDDGSGSTKKPYIGGALSYEITPLLGLNVLYEKGFNDNSLTAAAGAVRTRTRAELKYSVTDPLTLKAYLGHDKNEYKADTLGRKTELVYTGAAAEYQVNPQMGLRLGYDYRDVSSNIAVDEYQDNRITASITYSP